MKGLSKILNANQLREADTYTIKHEPICSIDLMKRASLTFVQALEKQVGKEKPVMVFCGTGNNGGDGFVVSRILAEKGYSVSTYLVCFSKELSPDCQLNANRLKKYTSIHTRADFPIIPKDTIVIDAIFGTGITRPTEGLAAEVIKHINESDSKVYAIDLPSGLPCDSITESMNVIQADFVISFERPKLSFFFPEHAPYINRWEVVSIGLDPEFLAQVNSNTYMLDARVSAFIKPRRKQSHKGSYGNSLMVAGSYGKMGAAVLATKAALRSGSGLVSAYTPRCGYEILQSAVPEAMCLTDLKSNHLSSLPAIDSYQAIGIGPGLGTDQETIITIETLLKNSTQALVIDADALNIISAHTHLLEFLPKHCILTPHIKEFERLAGTSKNSLDRLKKLQYFAKEYDCIVALKDAYTTVAHPDGKLYINTSGNAGMATGGSGDVLTGIITGILAQGYTALEASIIGVYYHGIAGDKAKETRGEHALIASDIIEYFNLS